MRFISCYSIQGMFTLYRIGFCSVSKVAPAQCEQELMFCCGAEIVPKRSLCEQEPCPSYKLQCCLLIWKDYLPKRGSAIRCNFCSDKSVHTWLRPFQKPIRYGTFHFQQRSRAVLFRSRNCFESSVPGVNRSHIRYTFCHAPFHYPVQCEHSLKLAHLCMNAFNLVEWYIVNSKARIGQTNDISTN